MGFLKKLSRLVGSSTPGSDAGALLLAVQCDRCGEVIHTRIDLSNDLSQEYDESSDATTYFCRKVLMGKQRCYQSIEVRLTFDSSRALIDRQITGGKFVEA